MANTRKKRVRLVMSDSLVEKLDSMGEASTSKNVYSPVKSSYAEFLDMVDESIESLEKQEELSKKKSSSSYLIPIFFSTLLILGVCVFFLIKMVYKI